MIDDNAFSGLTDVGLTRENNQDQFLIAELNKSMLIGRTSLPYAEQSRLLGSVQGHLMLVADGMGGHAGGEKASSMAIEYLVDRLLNHVHWFFKIDEDAENEFIASLKALLRDTHQRIQEEGKKDLLLQGMGTTLTMGYLVWPKLYVVHVGDSRCYLVRRGAVERLTTDHTLARRMIDSGGLKPEQEAGSRWSNVLWNVIGGRSEVELTAEVRSVTLEENDSLVFCSDGLHRYLTDGRLLDILDAHETPRAACEALLKIAKDAGGDDNITVIVARPVPGPGLESTITFEPDTSPNKVNYDTHYSHDPNID